MNSGYRFGRFQLDPKRRALTRDGAVVPVMPKGFDILLYLVEHPNRVVTKQELMKAVWPDTFVEEGNLTQNISVLRKAFAETGDDGLIVTVARQGYQFAGDVTEVIDSPPTPDREPVPHQERAAFRGRGWRREVGTAMVGLVIVGGIAVTAQRLRNASLRDQQVRLAVLPFTNLTEDSTQNYLAAGLTEEVITQLARLQPAELGVIARTSVTSYAKTNKRIDSIGRELGVQYVLESSLRRSGDRLRVTVQLVRTRDQTHLWASDFDYSSQDAIAIEDSVAVAVAQEIQLRLTPAERNRLAHVASTNPRAVEFVMRGRDRYLQHVGGEESWAIAKSYFDEAIALDSGYALAWAWLSNMCRVGADRGYLPRDQGIQEARQAVSRALDLDSVLPDAWERLGQLQMLVDWDWTAAYKSYRRALELDPGSLDALRYASSIDQTLGRLDEAAALAKRAMALDPLDPAAAVNLSAIYYYAGRFDEARTTFERLPKASQDLYPSILRDLDVAQGRLADAAPLIDSEPDPVWRLFYRAVVTSRQGARGAADSALSAFISQYGTIAQYQIAEIYGARHEADSAFAWLDRAYTRHDEGLWAVKIDPWLESLHGDPRFKVFLTKMHLPS